MLKKEAEMVKAEAPESEQDEVSEMDEWELDIIMRFGEKVRRDREERKRLESFMAGTRRMTLSSTCPKDWGLQILLVSRCVLLL